MRHINILPFNHDLRLILREGPMRNTSTLLRFFTLLLLSIRVLVHSQEVETRQISILQGKISVEAVKGTDRTNKIQPGSSVKLLLRIDNEGPEPNKPGYATIRYAFSKPLHNQPNSIIFQTEKIKVPSIEPGKSINIAFTKTHQWPSLIDFIRYDWSMREYQAILDIEDNEKIVGTLAITFSAYYYPGITEEYSIEVPGIQKN